MEKKKQKNKYEWLTPKHLMLNESKRNTKIPYVSGSELIMEMRYGK